MDHDALCVCVHSGGLAHANLVVAVYAQLDDDVCDADGAFTDGEQLVLQLVAEHASGFHLGKDGDVQVFCQLLDDLRFFGAIGGNLTQDQDGLLGSDQGIGSFFDQSGVAIGALGGTIVFRPDDSVFVAHTAYGVSGNLQIDGAGGAGQRLTEGHGDIFRSTVALVDLPRPLAEGFHALHAVDVLHGAHLILGQGRSTADVDQGDAGLSGFCHSGLDVGDTRAGGGDDHAGLAGDLSVSDSGVSAGAFMTDVDDADAFITAGVQDGHDMTTGKGEDCVDALFFQGFCKQFANADLTHGIEIPPWEYSGCTVCMSRRHTDHTAIFYQNPFRVFSVK